MVDSPSISADKLEHRRQCEHYGDLVGYGFGRLRRKYHPTTAEKPDQASVEHALSALSIDKVKSQEALANQLVSSLLPLLHHQVTSLSLALKISSLRDEPRANLRLVLQIQGELDSTVDGLKLLITTLCPEPISLSNSSVDHHLKRFKSYRLDRLKVNSQLLITWCLCDIFEAANERIQQMGLSSIPPKIDPGTDFPNRDMEVFVSRTLHTIKVMANCLNASELVVAQTLWKGRRRALENQLQCTIEKLDPSPDSKKVEDLSKPPDKYVAEPAIQLAKMTLPILKLCRIFFSKLSKRGLAQERIPIFTEICSDEIELLAQSTRDISEDLGRLDVHLKFTNADGGLNRDGGVTSEEFIEITQSLKTRFDPPLLLILMYFIPLIPDTAGLKVQKYYRNWCVTWKNQMALAVHNFEQVVKSLEDFPQ
ncbi:hypothetical protein MJO28_000666 [Puccinia striiformis f. sp. tritici]|uniref:Uncharacterized protein n=2 Tax=Puccinia striiformis TaxID=27350 RepID=A0A2S4W2P6_9BASI|nr:hypothetical protein Pst134EA_000589 [Puccinia striiformis f. sp. tritici]KAH9473510.1 hypothetical protein Pst134EA_000589 [Puccinia striiformis f. sp. tritici]KAI7962572.1 hypothetical protein MJO28_000666 [Puccinia striiformis f. sp. tritici]POW15999.1 hypothetical protein PSHT_06925 [Puccinia striiformis]